MKCEKSPAHKWESQLNSPLRHETIRNLRKICEIFRSDGKPRHKRLTKIKSKISLIDLRTRESVAFVWISVLTAPAIHLLNAIWTWNFVRNILLPCHEIWAIFDSLKNSYSSSFIQNLFVLIQIWTFLMLIQRKIVCFDAVSRKILFWNWTEFQDRLILRSVDVSVGESKQSEKKRE